MKKKMFTLASVVLALTFWFFDSLIHHFLYKEPQFELVPEDFNEFWMRSVIVLLIMLFGIFADYFINRIMIKQKQLEVANVYNLMIHTSRHVLNNLVNQMRLFEMEALKSKDFDRDVVNLYGNAIKEATDLIDALSRVEDTSEGKLWVPVDPLKDKRDSH